MTVSYLKKLNEFIWEFRTIYKRKTYRLFSFWNDSNEKRNLVITTHGIVKKNTKDTFKRTCKSREFKKTIF